MFLCRRMDCVTDKCTSFADRKVASEWRILCQPNRPVYPSGITPALTAAGRRYDWLQIEAERGILPFSLMLGKSQSDGSRYRVRPCQCFRASARTGDRMTCVILFRFFPAVSFPLDQAR